VSSDIGNTTGSLVRGSVLVNSGFKMANLGYISGNQMDASTTFFFCDHTPSLDSLPAAAMVRTTPTGKASVAWPCF